MMVIFEEGGGVCGSWFEGKAPLYPGLKNHGRDPCVGNVSDVQYSCMRYDCLYDSVFHLLR